MSRFHVYEMADIIRRSECGNLFGTNENERGELIDVSNHIENICEKYGCKKLSVDGNKNGDISITLYLSDKIELSDDDVKCILRSNSVDMQLRRRGNSLKVLLRFTRENECEH